MKEINKDFNVPYYIVEEIIDYVELTAQGHCECMKWKNIKALLRLAKINNRLTQKQVDFLINTYNKEH